MSMAEVIQLYPTIVADSDDTAAKTENEIHEPSIATTLSETDSETDRTQEYIGTEDLYPVSEEYNPELSTASQLLDESVDLLVESVEMLELDDLISSDDAIQRFRALLPELFCCRKLGDGFGTIVNSIFHAIRNMNNIPMNESQLRAILHILKRIRTEPFIEYDEAIEEIMHFEELGLDVSPPRLNFFSELLNG